MGQFGGSLSLVCTLPVPVLLPTNRRERGTHEIQTQHTVTVSTPTDQLHHTHRVSV